MGQQAFGDIQNEWGKTMAKQPRDPSREDDTQGVDKIAAKVSIFDQITRHERSTTAPAEKSDKTGTTAPTDKPSVSAVDRDASIAMESNRDTAGLQERAHELGEALYAKFMHILTEKVEEKSGIIEPDDITSMGEEFRKELQSIEDAFLDAVETYAQAQLQPREAEKRTKPFHRLMVHNFSRRFADERTLRANPALLSRRMLPGFFNVLLLMLGPDRLADYEKRADKIVQDAGVDQDHPCDWEQVYAAPAAKRLCLKAEIEIAQFFVQTEKRLQWMIAVINSNLITLDNDASGDAWTLNTTAAENLLSSLFRDLRAALTRPQTRTKIEDRMGTPSLNLLDVIVQRFA